MSLIWLAMDCSAQFLLLAMCAFGLVELCHSSAAYPHLENVKTFEVCVISKLYQSKLFTKQEKSQMSKIVKETDVRMQNLDVNSSNATNARTMLGLFTAALTNLVVDEENPLKTFERKQHLASALEICAKSLPDSAGSDLLSEASRVLDPKGNKNSTKFNKDDSTTSSRNVNLLEKAPGSEDNKSRRRAKRSPSSEAFQFNPPLDAVIAGALLTSPSFGKIFKDGLTKQDAIYYSRTMAESGLQERGYDYAMIGEVLDEITNAISTLAFMPQSVDYAFAISGSINKVFDSRGLATFADGIGITNAMISKLQKMTEIQNPAFSFTSSFGAVSSSSVWDSGIRTRDQQKEEPFQINPSWGAPFVPTFQMDSAKKEFYPDPFISSDTQFPLNPSFNPNTDAPLPSFDFESPSVDLPDSSSFSENIPFLEANPSLLINPEPVRFPDPVDPYFQGMAGIANLPTEEPIPFQFGDAESQNFPFTSFAEGAPVQHTGILNQQTSQEGLVNSSPAFDSFDFTFPQTSPQDFDLPAVSNEDTSLASFEDMFGDFSFDHLLKTEIPDQTSISLIPQKADDISASSEDLKPTAQSQTTLKQPSTNVPTVVQSLAFESEKPSGLSDTALPLNAEETQVFAGTFGSNVQESNLTMLPDIQTQPEPSENFTDVSLTIPSLEIANTPQEALLNIGDGKDLTSDVDIVDTGPLQLKNDSLNLDSTTTITASFPIDTTESSTESTTLSSIVDLFYRTFLTTKTVPTASPYTTKFAEEVKTPDKLHGLLMDEIDKVLNQAPTTTNAEIISVGSNPVEVDATNMKQVSSAAEIELQQSVLPTPLSSQSTSPQLINSVSATTTEKSTESQLDEEASLFAHRVSSIATSSIAYIRSGNLNIDELCSKLNVLAFMVDIPPLDNCNEIAMIDYLLNVLNAVIFNFGRN